MAVKIVDSQGNEIVGKVSLVFECDWCMNQHPFSHGICTYNVVRPASKTGKTKYECCSELCALDAERPVSLLKKQMPNGNPDLNP